MEETSIARPLTGVYIEGESGGRNVKMDSSQTPFGGGDKNMYLTEITKVVIVIGSDMYLLCTHVPYPSETKGWPKNRGRL